MKYHVLGKEIFINSMQKPTNAGSVWEFKGSSSLKEIGLSTKFYFRCNYGFSNELPVSAYQTEITDPKNDYQRVLSIFLQKSIWSGRLTNQFSEPFI